MSDQNATVALGLGSLKPTGVLALNTKIVAGMAGNTSFLTPTVPLDELTEAGSKYQTEENAIAAEEIKLQARRTVNKGKLAELKKMMSTQGNYVNSVAQGSRGIIESAGMPASAVPQPLGKLPKVTGLGLTSGGAKTQVKAKWDIVAKTLGCNGYMVYWGPTPDNMPNKEYAPLASLLLVNLPSGQDIWFCVRALGKESGDCSDPVAQMVP